jgi:hypothetical protein
MGNVIRGATYKAVKTLFGKSGIIQSAIKNLRKEKEKRDNPCKRKAIPKEIKDAIRKRSHDRCEDHHGPHNYVRLENHHINGDPCDNRIENIVRLCSNCHDRWHVDNIQSLQEERK